MAPSPERLLRMVATSTGPLDLLSGTASAFGIGALLLLVMGAAIAVAAQVWAAPKGQRFKRGLKAGALVLLLALISLMDFPLLGGLVVVAMIGDAAWRRMRERRASARLLVEWSRSVDGWVREIAANPLDESDLDKNSVDWCRRHEFYYDPEIALAMEADGVPIWWPRRDPVSAKKWSAKRRRKGFLGWLGGQLYSIPTANLVQDARLRRQAIARALVFTHMELESGESVPLK